VSPSSEADRALQPYLLAADTDDARARLGDLLQQVAAPVARDVIRGHLRGVSKSDLDDVHAGVLLALAAHLRGARRPGDSTTPIRDLTGYVATIAHNACHAFLRTRFPHRAHLRSRVRYVLTRDPALALWEAGKREWLCGAAAQRGSGRHGDATARLGELGRQVGGRASLPELIRSLLRQLPGPARFDDLVDAVMAIQGIEDAPPGRRAGEDEVERLREQPDPGPSPEAALAQRDFLSRLWSEIRLLPAGQRAALLLNLRDADGRGMVALFPLTGTATLPDLAGAIGMPEERLRALWDELPRDDAWIAEWLGVTPRQVINLRKCARERLARRMKKDAW
jgi:DNA-directed RNA polymerase specialized sigma24 family protein